MRDKQAEGICTLESLAMNRGDREKEAAYVQKPVFQVTFTPAHVAMALLSFSLAALLAYVNLLSKPEPTVALDNGVGRLPCEIVLDHGYPLSPLTVLCQLWDITCDINETVIRESADLLVSLGLKDLGYNYMNIDDCYAEKNRTADGDIVESAERFPSGMRNLTDYIHDKGLKAGIYSDSGWFTCQLYPGSFQNEER
ncbi:glycoside hydrolase superfamily, partial [Schizophyllum fasciatum]